MQRLAPGAGTTVWTWTPLWEQAIERKRPGSGSYVYVPLELRQTVEPHILKMEDKRRYLRFEQVNNQWLASVRSYFYTLPKGGLQPPITEVSAAKFLSTFTGDVLTQVLETGEVTHSTYRNGKWQPPQSNKPASGTAARASAYCGTFYDCSWYLSCPPPYTYRDVRIIGTTGQDYCEPPYGYTLECGYETQYDLQASYSYQACEDTGDDPGNPGDNGDGGGSSASYEYINPNYVFTQVPPPDVTAYNCGQLRDWHGGDDRFQQGQEYTLEDFINENSGKTRADIISQRGFQSITKTINGVPITIATLPYGPRIRYIRDPLNPDIVIDLRHMLVVGPQGEIIGNSLEIIQGMSNDPAVNSSAYNHQDYYSNQLGYDFTRAYGADFGPQGLGINYIFYLKSYLTNPSYRSRNVNPVLVNQRCP